MTWPPPQSASNDQAKRGAIEALLKTERNGSLDDADYWMKRIGFSPPEIPRK